MMVSCHAAAGPGVGTSAEYIPCSVVSLAGVVDGALVVRHCIGPHHQHWHDQWRNMRSAHSGTACVCHPLCSSTLRLQSTHACCFKHQVGVLLRGCAAGGMCMIRSMCGGRTEWATPCHPWTMPPSQRWVGQPALVTVFPRCSCLCGHALPDASRSLCSLLAVQTNCMCVWHQLTGGSHTVC